jgi:hypothetical protein
LIYLFDISLQYKFWIYRFDISFWHIYSIYPFDIYFWYISSIYLFQCWREIKVYKKVRNTKIQAANSVKGSIDIVPILTDFVTYTINQNPLR